MGKIELYKEKIQAMSPATKASFALIIAKFFQKGMSMISGPIFTRIMPQAEYGLVSTFTSWQSVLYIIATLNMSQGVFNNGMIDYKEDRDIFTYSLMCLANVCTLLTATIYILTYQWASEFIDMPAILMVVMLLYFIFTPAYNFWMGRQRFEYKYKAITFVMIGASLLSTVLAIVAVLCVYDGRKAVARIVAMEAVSIAIGLVMYIRATVKAKGKIDLSYWKYALKFNLPLIPHYLSMYVLSSSDRIMISKLAGSDQTAIYNVAYTVASIMLIFWNSVDAAYAPWIYQHMDENNIEPIKKRGNQVVIFFGGVTIFFSLFAPEIIRILAPESYYMGIYVVPAVAAGVFFTACYSLYMRIELFLKKNKSITAATILTAVLNVVLNYFFIPIYGFTAAGYTTLVCYALLALFHGYNLKRIGYGSVYDNKRVAMISLLVIVASLCIINLYGLQLIRYCFIVIIMIVGYRKRHTIISLAKNNGK